MEQLLKFFTGIALSGAILVFLLTVILRLLARQLRLVQALYLSFAGAVAWLALVVSYNALEHALGITIASFGGSFLGGSITLGSFCVMGTVITRLSRQYGIEKVGWLGVGAKAALSLFALGSFYPAIILFKAG
jgi:4-amino-4-deoxy-L-arabinose transferase-like glycosyltransferase